MAREVSRTFTTIYYSWPPAIGQLAVETLIYTCVWCSDWPASELCLDSSVYDVMLSVKVQDYCRDTDVVLLGHRTCMYYVLQIQQYIGDVMLSTVLHAQWLHASHINFNGDVMC